MAMKIKAAGASSVIGDATVTGSTIFATSLIPRAKTAAYLSMSLSG